MKAMMKYRFQITLLLLLILFQACKTYEASLSGTQWEKYNQPEVAGYDAAELAKLSDYIDNNARTTGMVVIHDGKLLYQYGDIEKISYIASCRKSVLSMLYGKHVDNNSIDLNESIGNLGVDEKDGLLPIEKQATVYDIITSRSGVFHKASNGGYDKENALERGSVEPGDYFLYNNWDFNVAGYILEHYTGSSIYQDMEEQLAKPLGFQDWNLKNQKKSGNKSKSQYQAYHMYLSTRDMAKIGQLMLNEGVWDGKQIIPANWVKASTSTVTPHETLVERWGAADPNTPQMSYGYMWWLMDNYLDNPSYEGAYTAIGYGGQYITVIPKEKLVIAHKTKLKLFTMIGIAYKGTDDKDYWKMIDLLVNAKKNERSVVTP